MKLLAATTGWLGRAVPGAGIIAALAAAVAGARMLLITTDGVGQHLGRISVFVPGVVAILIIACAAGALTHRTPLSPALLGTAAAGLWAVGSLWIWIRLFTAETGVLLLIAAGLATLAAASEVVGNRRRVRALLSVATGACIGLLLLGAVLSVSTAWACGPGGSSFHIDSWHTPWAAAYVCGDGRLSFEFWP